PRAASSTSSTPFPYTTLFRSNLPVRVGETGMLPLNKVAELTTVSSVDPIRRDAGQRRAAIMVNLRGRDVESFVHEAEAKVKAAVDRKSTRLNSSHDQISYAVF